MSTNSRKILIARLLLTFGYIALTLILFEYYLRNEVTHVVRTELASLGGFIEANPEFLVQDTPRGRRFVPGAKVIIKNHYLSKIDVPVSINSAGFRGPEIPESKQPNERRLFFLGDSVMVADYLVDEATIPRIIEKRLSFLNPGQTIRAINGSIGNIGTEEEVNILEDAADIVQPDIVILGYYLNDSRPPWGFSGEIGDRGWLRRRSLIAETIYQQLEQRRWIAKQGIDRFAWIAQSLRLDWRTDPKDFQILADHARYDWGAAWQMDSWVETERQLRRLKQIAAKHQSRVLVIAFPVSYQVEASFVEDTPQQKLKAIAGSLGFEFLDMLPILREGSEKKLFYDHCHPTRAGNEVIAEAVLDALRSNNLL